MKLIDILLRELPKRDGWPSTYHKAVNDSGCIRFDSYRGTSFRPVWSSGMVDPSLIEEITRVQYESVLFAMKQKSWGGVGLPPIGTKVEWRSEKYGWIGGTVAAHDHKYPLVAIIRHNDGYVGCHRDEIRTENDKKRDYAVGAMERAWESVTDKPAYKFEVIYDAIAAGEIPGIIIE